MVRMYWPWGGRRLGQVVNGVHGGNDWNGIRFYITNSLLAMRKGQLRIGQANHSVSCAVYEDRHTDIAWLGVVVVAVVDVGERLGYRTLAVNSAALPIWLLRPRSWKGKSAVIGMCL